MITRKQVADLQPGDVVEFRIDDWEAGQAIRGPLALSDSFPDVLEVRIPGGGQYWVRSEDGCPFDPENRTLIVVSRAPRPLYVNHPRTKPVPGDVAGPAETGANDGQTWHFLDGIGSQWFDKRGYGLARDELPAPLRLLVDGETGRCVP